MQPNVQAAGTPQHATSDANDTAVITLAAATDTIHALDSLQWSYSAAPTGGKLTIAIGGSTVWEVDITAAGAGPNIIFPKGVYQTTGNEAMVLTLAAGGGAIVGKLNAQTR
jgi:hypothetical protein